MRKLLIIIIMILSVQMAKAQNHYVSESGLIFKVGDTIKIGQPLSHLGFRSIYINRGDTYITNKNLVTKVVTITEIDTVNKPVNFSVEYKRRFFKVDIDEALRNKEVIPILELSPPKLSKYDDLLKIKELFDLGVLNQEEYENEKNKILNAE